MPLDNKNETKAEKAKKQSSMAKILTAIGGVVVAAFAIFFGKYKKR